jgi:hypothetical protein
MAEASFVGSERFGQGEFRIGGVLRRTWSVLSRNFLAFFLVTAIASLPDILLEDLGQSRGWVIFGLFLSDVMRRLSQAALLHGAFQQMRGKPVSLTQSFQVGLRRFFPVIRLAIAASLLTMLAATLFVIPGVIVYLMLFVATPVCVVEQLGPLRSMERSQQLTQGHRWKLLGLLLLMLLPAVVVVGVFESIEEFAETGVVMTAVCELICNAIVGAGYATLVIATYHDLRVAKEGVDTEQIAAVFQ